MRNLLSFIIKMQVRKTTLITMALLIIFLELILLEGTYMMLRAKEIKRERSHPIIFTNKEKYNIYVLYDLCYV